MSFKSLLRADVKISGNIFMYLTIEKELTVLALYNLLVQLNSITRYKNKF